MKIWMHRYLRGSAHSSLTIDEGLLKDVNTDLAHSYVIANNLSEAPPIKESRKGIRPIPNSRETAKKLAR